MERCWKKTADLETWQSLGIIRPGKDVQTKDDIMGIGTASCGHDGIFRFQTIQGQGAIF